MPDSYSTYTQPFFDTLAQGTQVAQHLRQAAQQHEEFMAEQRQQDADRALRAQQQSTQQNMDLASMLQNGGKAVDDSGNVSVTAPAPTWQRGTDGMLHQALVNGGPVSLPADPNQTVSIGGRQVQVPTQQQGTDQAVANKTALWNVGKVPLTDETADAVGVRRGTLFDPDSAGFSRIVDTKYRTDNKPQQEGPKLVKTEITKDDKGKQTAVQVFDDGSVREKPIDAQGTSDKFGNPELAAANTTAKSMTENQRATSAQQALKDYQRLLGEQQGIEDENRNLNIALKGGRHYVDQNGQLIAFSSKNIDKKDQAGYQDGMRQRLQANASRLPQVISDREGAMNRYADLSGNSGARPQSAPAGAPAPVAGPQQQPSAAPSGLPKGNGGQLDKGTAAKFLQAAGGDKTKARQLAKQANWKF